MVGAIPVVRFLDRVAERRNGVTKLALSFRGTIPVVKSGAGKSSDVTNGSLFIILPARSKNFPASLKKGIGIRI